MKRKVLFILHLPPPVHGASMVGKYLHDSELIKNSFECDFINLSTSKEIKDIGKSGFKKLFGLIKLFLKVLTALRKKNFDLCYITINATGAAFLKDLLIVIILKLFGKKIIYHFHNKGITANSPNWLKNKLYRFAFQNTKSILLSPSLYPDFKKYLSTKDVYFCANGIPTFQSSHILPKTLQNTKDNCRLLFLSNMIVEKGIITLLEACKRLKEKGNNFECHFVGAWFNISETNFKNFVDKNDLAQNVFAHGAKFNNDKRNFFLTSDIFVLPTYYSNECFPLVLLEAMSYGLPVVSTSEGGIPDIVINEKTGFIIQPNDVCELASKIEILIKSPNLRKEYGTEGRKRFLNFFTVEKFENNMVEILKSSIFESNS
jgi:glycosyltransferase involved in cell wall biosynthesis